MGRDKSSFGFNFADGRVKSYPRRAERYVRAVRGNPNYGKNHFVANSDGTITDHSTGLIWLKTDSDRPMNWQQALNYAKNSRAAGKDDWRLPNVREIQSIVVYTRAPDSRDVTRRSAAIDPIFGLTEQESWFWSSTTHKETGFAYYVAFGQAFSAKKWEGKPINAHGAGAVRSDPKVGSASRWSKGLGPQSDEIRINNFVRLVRGGDVSWRAEGQPELIRASGMTVRQPRMQQAAKRIPRGFIGRLDADGDGVVGRAEFDGPSRHFQRMDLNGDGFIDSTEAPLGPPKRAGNSGGRLGRILPLKSGFNFFTQVFNVGVHRTVGHHTVVVIEVFDELST